MKKMFWKGRNLCTLRIFIQPRIEPYLNPFQIGHFILICLRDLSTIISGIFFLCRRWNFCRQWKSLARFESQWGDCNFQANSIWSGCLANRPTSSYIIVVSPSSTKSSLSSSATPTASSSPSTCSSIEIRSPFLNQYSNVSQIYYTVNSGNF